MITKKQIQSLSTFPRECYERFTKMDFQRYKEIVFTKNGYSKKIIFYYKDKFTIEIPLTKSQYYEWRKILEELIKTK